MIHSDRFIIDEEYRKESLQLNPQDHPIVAHFAANDSNIILQATKLIESQVDAIDINLGCPQRIAYTGHFGSYLLDKIDRPLVLNMIQTLSTNLTIPIFVKIRLLDNISYPV